MARPDTTTPGLMPGIKVYYPTHGVGDLVSTVENEVAGTRLKMHVISFPRERMTLRVPTNKARSNGLVPLATFANEADIKRALHIIGKDRKTSRAMWSRRAAEFEAKINSGSLISLAEVIRDLIRERDDGSERSYSENDLLREAGRRLIDILAATWDKDPKEIETFLNDHLKKHGKTEIQFYLW